MMFDFRRNENGDPAENENNIHQEKKNYFDFSVYCGFSTSLFLVMLYYVAVLKEKDQFYEISVEITSSKANLLILGNFALAILILAGKLLSRLIFGILKAKEVDFLNEQLIISGFDTLFFLIMFRSDIDKFFAMRIAVLYFLKSFHWISQKRTDSLFQAPEIPTLTHLRMFTLLNSLLLFDLAFMISISNSVFVNSYSVDLLFLLEYSLLFLLNLSIITKYVCETIEYSKGSRWELKNGILVWAKLFLAVLELLVYLFFFGFVTIHHSFPVHILRHLYHSIQTLLDRAESLNKYKQTNEDLDKNYPPATTEELLAAETCPVCFHNFEDEGRKVPCPSKHVVHKACLRDWLEKSQTCPFCKKPFTPEILRENEVNNNNAFNNNNPFNNAGNFGNNNNNGQPPFFPQNFIIPPNQPPYVQNPQNLQNFPQNLQNFPQNLQNFPQNPQIFQPNLSNSQTNFQTNNNNNDSFIINLKKEVEVIRFHLQKIEQMISQIENQKKSKEEEENEDEEHLLNHILRISSQQNNEENENIKNEENENILKNENIKNEENENIKNEENENEKEEKESPETLRQKRLRYFAENNNNNNN